MAKTTFDDPIGQTYVNACVGWRRCLLSGDTKRAAEFDEEARTIEVDHPEAVEAAHRYYQVP